MSCETSGCAGATGAAGAVATVSDGAVDPQPATAPAGRPAGGSIDGSFFLLVAALEIERGRIDAVSQPRGLRAVVENVPEVGPAVGAGHFLADHAVTAIDVRPHAVARQRQPE